MVMHWQIDNQLPYRYALLHVLPLNDLTGDTMIGDSGYAFTVWLYILHIIMLDVCCAIDVHPKSLGVNVGVKTLLEGWWMTRVMRLGGWGGGVHCVCIFWVIKIYGTFTPSEIGCFQGVFPKVTARHYDLGVHFWFDLHRAF